MAARDILINILTRGDASGVETVSSGLDRMAEQAQRAGTRLTTFVTAPLVGFGAVAVKFAADAQEAGDKLQVVFGDRTAQVNARIQELRQSIPATTGELQGMFAGLQDLLVPLGLAPDEASKMTDSIVTLAGDLASFNNLPTKQVLSDIQSGLVGQFEPLQKYGVALNASTVKAEAFARGIGDGKRQLTASERAQVAYQLILENTTAAHGNAADTADSAANQLKFLGKESKELMTIIGEQLLPVVTPLVSGLVDLARSAQDADPLLVKVGIGLAGVAAATGPLLIGLAATIRSIQTVASVATGATARLGGLAAAGRRTGAVLRTAFPVAGALALGAAIGTALDKLTGFSDAVADWHDGNLDAQQEVLNGYRDIVREAREQVRQIESAADAEEVRADIIEQRGRLVRDLNNARQAGEDEIADTIDKQIQYLDRTLEAIPKILERNQGRIDQEREIEHLLDGERVTLEEVGDAIREANRELTRTEEVQRLINGLTDEQLQSRSDLVEQLKLEKELLQAKLDGDEETIAKLERQQAIRDQINRLTSSGLVTDEEARVIATDMVDLRQRVREERETENGVSSEGNDLGRARNEILREELDLTERIVSNRERAANLSDRDLLGLIEQHSNAGNVDAANEVRRELSRRRSEDGGGGSARGGGGGGSGGGTAAANIASFVEGGGGGRLAAALRLANGEATDADRRLLSGSQPTVNPTAERSSGGFAGNSPAPESKGIDLVENVPPPFVPANQEIKRKLAREARLEIAAEEKELISELKKNGLAVTGSLKQMRAALERHTFELNNFKRQNRNRFGK